MTIYAKFILTALTLGSMSFCVNAYAGTFKTPRNYHIVVIDGKKVSGMLSETTKLELSEGQHQIVVQFKGLFRKGSDQYLYSAVDPIVVNLSNTGKDDEITFTYPRVTTYEQAQNYSNNQKIELIINDKPANKEDASYFILTSEKGFQLDRDYIADLEALNLLYISKENTAEIASTDETLKRCRDSGFTDCPDSIKAPIVKTPSVKEIKAQDPEALTATANTQAPTKGGIKVEQLDREGVNTQMLEGLKSIFNTADHNTQEAFKEWLNNKQ